MSDTFVVGGVQVKVDSATVSIGYDDYPVRNIQMVKLVPADLNDIKARAFLCGFIFYGTIAIIILLMLQGVGIPAVLIILAPFLACPMVMTDDHIVRFDNSKTGQVLLQGVGYTYTDGVKACLTFKIDQSKYYHTFNHIKTVADRIKQAIHDLQHTS